MRTLMACMLCVAGAAFLMRFELHTDDTGVEVAMVLALSLLLGAVQPARPWLWGLIVGLSIPLSEVLFGTRSWSMVPVGAFTLALALAGSYGGALLVRALGGRPQHG